MDSKEKGRASFGFGLSSTHPLVNQLDKRGKCIRVMRGVREPQLPVSKLNKWSID